MQAIETTAIFNEKGEMIIDKLPSIKNKKVKLLILIEEDEKDFHALSSLALNKAYGEDEPEYELSLVKEPNPEYKK